MSLGAWVLGLLNGLTIGLLAVGLVLVYKSNRFLNLAHAQLGTLSALLLAKWVLDWGWSWWAAFGLAILLGIATGLLVERFLVAPLRRRTDSPIRLLLLSLGVSELLLALTYVPRMGPNQVHAGFFPQPFQSHVRIGDVALTGMSWLTAILVPILVAGLALFMKYSFVGKQIRAAANNPDAARLCGVSVHRVSAVTWGLAGGFAAVSAVLQAPTQASFNIASLGPYLLMLTLGAAAFGAFVSLPGALAGGLVLGVVSQLVRASTSSGAKAEVAVFIVILAIILLRARAIGRVFELSGAVVDEPPVTRVPDVVSTSALVRHHRLWLALGALVVAALWPLLPYFHTSGNEFLLSLVLVYAVIGVGLTMLLGWGGQVSLGQFAVVGLGAYLTARWSAHGWSLPALYIAIGLIGAAVLVAVGLPALRVPGLTLAVTTLGFAVIGVDWLFHQAWVASSQPFGITVPSPNLGPGLGTPRSQLAIYYVALVTLALALGAATALRRSIPGRVIVAVRDNERASASFGINPATVKLTILGVTGFFAGVAGVLWADAWKAVSPTQFTADVSIAVIAIPVIGGLGSLAGATAAAVVLYASAFFIGPHVAGLFGSFGHNLGFGLALGGFGQVFALHKMPNGLAGVAQGQWQRYLDRRAQRLAPAPSTSDTTVAPQPDLGQASDRAALGAGGTNWRVPATSDGAPALQVKGVRVRFGGLVALDEPDVVVAPGAIVGLIGANGAGKTTLMNVISGHLTPDRGSVAVFGNEIGDLPPDLRAAFGLGRSFQDASLFAGLTVTETVQVAIAQRHKVGVVGAMVAAPWVRTTERRTRREAERIIARFGLATWADDRTFELSTGTRRICDLAAQVAAQPKLLLLDEPTAGVAQRDAEAFGPLLRTIRDELDCSVLIVEHDMPLLMGLCDRIYALEAGQVIATGTPDEIRHNPRVIASYLGTEETAIRRSGALASRSRPRRVAASSRRAP